MHNLSKSYPETLKTMFLYSGVLLLCYVQVTATTFVLFECSLWEHTIHDKLCDNFGKNVEWRIFSKFFALNGPFFTADYWFWKPPICFGRRLYILDVIFKRLEREIHQNVTFFSITERVLSKAYIELATPPPVSLFWLTPPT